MNTDTIYDVVRKLVGPIRPVGETTQDNARFESLKVMCALMDLIHSDLDAIAYDYRNDKQFSIKRSVEYVDEFLDKIGIRE